MKKLPIILENVYDKLKGMKGTEDFIAFYQRDEIKEVKQEIKSKNFFTLIQKKQKRYKLIEDIHVMDRKYAST